MRILYVTTWVLGDAGANAAEIFPKLAAQDTTIETVIVADFPRNKSYVQTHQKAEFLKLAKHRVWLRHAFRIARKAREENIDVIHVFYRQQNAVLAALIRFALVVLGARARILMDHRSVNLAQGARRVRKMMGNQIAQVFCHDLAGNPWAVETNYFSVWRPSHTIDLGYDTLPDVGEGPQWADSTTRNIWFIGSLKPRNRKSQFLIEVLQGVANRILTDPDTEDLPISLRIAGPATSEQTRQLQANPLVEYYGQMPRAKLYDALRQHPGVGLAYMNNEYHGYAPSLKFVEYAAMRFKILASATLGLKTQAERMNLDGIEFLPEDVDGWADAIVRQARMPQQPQEQWSDITHWSYHSIFERQVTPLYREIAGQIGAAGQVKRKSLSDRSATPTPKT